VQDTTFFNYTHHPQTDGLGEIGIKAQNQRGFGMHSTLAVTSQGLPLGLLTQQFLERPIGEASHTASETQKLPIEEKESYRWIEAFEQVIALSPEKVQVVTVCDCEAISMRCCRGKREQADLLVRANTNRRLDEEAKYLWAKVESQRKAGDFTVDIIGNDKRKARQAIVSVRFCTVRLRPSWRPQQKKLPPVTLTAVLVREDNPPADIKEPVEWVLLTNTTVKAFAKLRKSLPGTAVAGRLRSFTNHQIRCRVEDCRLQTVARLQNYIALMCGRMAFTMADLHQPHKPTGILHHGLTTIEWQALYMRIHKTSALPNSPPSTYQAIRWIAQLGGFLGRKSDGEPGIVAIGVVGKGFRFCCHVGFDC